MNNHPDFLPPMLSLDGTYVEIIERLYEVFRRDFIKNRARHLGRDVAYNGVFDETSQGKVEGFWHVVTRDDSAKKDRLIDYRRAERLPWSRPLMENPYHDEIKFFFYDEGSARKGVRHYIWFERGNYLVILKKRKYDYYWITAFHVDSHRLQYYQKRFEERAGP